MDIISYAIYLKIVLVIISLFINVLRTIFVPICTEFNLRIL